MKEYCASNSYHRGHLGRKVGTKSKKGDGVVAVIRICGHARGTKEKGKGTGGKVAHNGSWHGDITAVGNPPGLNSPVEILGVGQGKKAEGHEREKLNFKTRSADAHASAESQKKKNRALKREKNGNRQRRF